MEKISHNNQKKIAVINDISGFGRCSLTVSIPIISQLKIQCCPVPTSIFSNHTGFESFFFDDYTEKIPAYINEWKKLGLEFEGIYSGFLGSKKQIDIVESFIKEFKTEKTKIIIDPVMGDHGKKYQTYTDEMCNAMKKLTGYADIITPNITECCILTDREYKAKNWTKKELVDMASRLVDMGSEKVIITGIHQGQFVSNFIYSSVDENRFVKTHFIGKERSGTGDVFASIIAADAVNNVDLFTSVKRASVFVRKALEISEKMNIPVTDGVCFEEIISGLKTVR